MSVTLSSISITSGGTYSPDFRIDTKFKIVITGTWSGTVTLQKKFASDYSDVDRFTSNVNKKYNGDGIYRFCVKSGHYTSGTIVVTLSLIEPNDDDTDYDGIIDSVVWNDIITYGADPTGVADSTSAIQDALDDGGVVLIPSGTFLVSPVAAATWLKVGSNTTVMGFGNSSVLKVKNDAGDYWTIFGQSSALTRVENISFSNFRIDQNISNNSTCSIDDTNINTAQNAIYFSNFANVSVKNVSFACSGVNTVSLTGGLGNIGASVVDNVFEFELGTTADLAGYYDNSAVYVNCKNHVISGNQFIAALTEYAQGAIETHGGAPSTVYGNITDGYSTGVNVVSQSSTDSTSILANDISVFGNSIYNAELGIRLWSITDKTLKNVVVSGNSISISNADRESNTYVGVSTILDTGGTLDGDYDGIVISDNIVRLQAEERAGASAQSGGIILAQRGILSNVGVTGNQIIDSPVFGIKASSSVDPINQLNIENNKIVDAGNNSAATAGYRACLYTSGVITRSRIAGNLIVDTGETQNGSYGIVNAAGAGSSVIERDNNVVVSVAGGALSRGFSTYSFTENKYQFNIAGNVSFDAMQYSRADYTLTDVSPAFTLTHYGTYKRGQKITINVVNSSGGAGPEITWTGFKLAAWTNPANGTHKLIEFECLDGTNYQETWRSGDIPN